MSYALYFQIPGTCFSFHFFFLSIRVSIVGIPDIQRQICPAFPDSQNSQINRYAAGLLVCIIDPKAFSLRLISNVIRNESHHIVYLGCQSYLCQFFCGSHSGIDAREGAAAWALFPFLYRNMSSFRQHMDFKLLHNHIRRGTAPEFLKPS